MTCTNCRKALSFNECGLHKKLNANAAPLCLACLARKFGVSEERLREKIAEYRAAGCKLFTEE